MTWALAELCAARLCIHASTVQPIVGIDVETPDPSTMRVGLYFQLLVIVLICVKNCMPPLPYMLISPRKEPREPVQLNMGNGTCGLHRIASQRLRQAGAQNCWKLTGMGTLSPTCPTSTSIWNLRAAAPSAVNSAVPFP